MNTPAAANAEPREGVIARYDALFPIGTRMTFAHRPGPDWKLVGNEGPFGLMYERVALLGT